MTANDRPIPSGFQGIVPYICVRRAADAMVFYKEAFGATESFRLAEPGGKIGHAEIAIAGGMLMLSDEYPDHGALSPQTVGGTPVALHLYVDDVDAFVSRAVAAGARLLRPVEDQFFGDRSGMLEDPFGHKWHIATHKEDVAPEEMQRRWDEAMSARG